MKLWILTLLLLPAFVSSQTSGRSTVSGCMAPRLHTNIGIHYKSWPDLSVKSTTYDGTDSIVFRIAEDCYCNGIENIQVVRDGQPVAMAHIEPLYTCNSHQFKVKAGPGKYVVTCLWTAYSAPMQWTFILLPQQTLEPAAVMEPSAGTSGIEEPIPVYQNRLLRDQNNKSLLVESSEAILALELRDPGGRLLKTLTEIRQHQAWIHVSGLAQGLYYILVATPSGKAIYKTVLP